MQLLGKQPELGSSSSSNTASAFFAQSSHIVRLTQCDIMHAAPYAPCCKSAEVAASRLQCQSTNARTSFVVHKSR
jgi:hypothetical protein